MDSETTSASEPPLTFAALHSTTLPTSLSYTFVSPRPRLPLEASVTHLAQYLSVHTMPWLLMSQFFHCGFLQAQGVCAMLFSP